MTENHHFQIMLHQIEQAQRANPKEARKREHVRQARLDRRLLPTHRIRDLISGLTCRLSRRSSAPCWDAGVHPAR
jgi:hypothetical protein